MPASTAKAEGRLPTPVALLATIASASLLWAALAWAVLSWM